MFRPPTLAVSILMVLVGCSGANSGVFVDGGVSDSGIPGADAGYEQDAGPKVDSGHIRDAGVDATMPASDAGHDTGSLIDAGHDAGIPATDSGHDGGMPTSDATLDTGTDSGVSFTLTAGDELAISTYAQRKALGFQYGYVDGVLGAVTAVDAGYTFFGSAHTVSGTACPGTPNTQGAYRFGISPTSITTDFGCKALLTEPTDGTPLSDGGVLGDFNRDYLGGGPVLRVTSADGTKHGILMTYHAEFHWGPSCGDAPCFYGTLGMGFSTDDGQTFVSLGEIIQPYITRPAAVALGADISIGGGPIVLGDASGGAVDPATAVPASTYIYIFFPDQDPAVTCGGGGGTITCLAVARALESDVIAAAFAGTTPVFQKYYAGAFTEPGWGGDPNDAVNSGHYSTILDVPGFSPSVLYDRTINQYILAVQSQDSMVLRTSPKVTTWSAPDLTITDTGSFDRYPSLLGELPDPDIGGAAPWVYFSQVTPANPTTGGDWPATTFKRIQLNVTVTP